MNKISCFAVNKITNAVKGNKNSANNQKNDENHDYTNSDGNGSTSVGTPLLKRNSKVSLKGISPTFNLIQTLETN